MIFARRGLLYESRVDCLSWYFILAGLFETVPWIMNYSKLLIAVVITIGLNGIGFVQESEA